ncbi:MAG: DUF1134 domain-containing protein [Gammaproteobacteria bacterium]|nr:DUF1134 domain-containing protein [Gammaproteobacteria bacterium]
MTRLYSLTAAGILIASILMMPLVSAAEDVPAGAVGQVAAGVATVESIDRQTREITLKGENGSATITAGPEVRNFDRIKRGDLVVFEYFEGLAIALVPSVEGVPARDDKIAAARAKKGDKPSMAIAEVITAEGRVKAIDHKNRVVTLEGPKRTISLKVSEEVDLKKISVGDAVLARYERAYAISVQPPADVDAEVLLESTSVAFIVGVDWGTGTLTLRDGQSRNLKVNGLSVIDIGVSKSKTQGYVYNLNNIEDFEGNYGRAEASIAMVGGVSSAVLRNSNGVIIRLISDKSGLKLTLAPGGMKIKFVE